MTEYAGGRSYGKHAGLLLHDAAGLAAGHIKTQLSSATLNCSVGSLPGRSWPHLGLLVPPGSTPTVPNRRAVSG